MYIRLECLIDLQVYYKVITLDTPYKAVEGNI